MLARELRRAWQEGRLHLGDALEEVTVEARRVQTAYAAWSDAGALLDLGQVDQEAGAERRAA